MVTEVLQGTAGLLDPLVLVEVLCWPPLLVLVKVWPKIPNGRPMPAPAKAEPEPASQQQHHISIAARPPNETEIYNAAC